LFIPVLPYGIVVNWHCSRCRNEIDRVRPSRPFILIAGVCAGILLFIMGLLIVNQAGDAVGYWLSLIGLFVTAGLIYVIRKQDYAAFSIASKAVIPLAGDLCPYCKEPLLPKVTPRCYSCRVNILTR
jgi:hypothetical protein